MPIARVQKLYPGGRLKKQPNGDATYAVIKPVGDISTAIVFFIFRPPEGLTAVSIAFPSQGDESQHETNEEAAKTRNSLRRALVRKYGEPTRSEEDSDFWLLPDGDGVQLNVTIEDDSHKTVGLVYGPIKTLIDRSGKGI